MKNTMKKLLCSLLIMTICITTLTSVIANAANEADIPDDAVEFNGHYYKLYDKVSETWQEAQVYCESLGGHLATITSQEENDFLYNYIIDCDYENVYFGLSDHETEGTWKWVTGEEVNYTNWGKGEPNTENSGEDYAMFYYKKAAGTWNDGDFGKATARSGKAFICEWDAESSSQEPSSDVGSLLMTILIAIWEFIVSIFEFFFGLLF